MRGLELNVAIETKDEKQQEKKQVYIGTKVLKRGHLLWEVNSATMETIPVTFEIVAADYVSATKGDTSGKRKLVTKAGCMYFSALNKKNAQKHFFKYLDSVIP